MATLRTNDDAVSQVDSRLIDTLAKALVSGALPGETNGFSKSDRITAATVAGLRARFEAQCVPEHPFGDRRRQSRPPPDAARGCQ